MKQRLQVVFALSAFVGLAAVPACQPGFPSTVSTQRLAVTVTSANQGQPDSRLGISFDTPTIFTVDIQAEDANGNLDTSFNGYVRASVVPGTVLSVTGPNTTGRNALLVNGQAHGVQVSVLEVYGNANIWFEDVGYIPVDPLRVPPPACANGLDDNDNGKVDMVDPGCYAANDDTENGGTYAAAVTDTLYFDYPRIADVRGISNGGSATPFNNQQLTIDTGWVAPGAGGGVVVTGVSSSGFYATDIGDPRNQFTSVYAYNYTAPPIMLPCDRLITFGGTAGDFYGYTEINFPTWSLEEWDPLVRGCLVPPAAQLTAGDLAASSLSVLLNLEAALVQVVKGTVVTKSGGSTESVSTSLHIGSHFGPGLVDQNTYQATADASDCDYNGDGKIEFLTNCGPAMNEACPEDACATACQADVECSEYSAYLTESQFRLVVESTTTTTPAGGTPSTSSTTNTIQGVGSADPLFNPVQLKGQDLGGFTGNLLYFSGGSQFTIQARCQDDIVTDPKGSVLPTSCPQNDSTCHAACVIARNAADQTNAN